MRHWFLSALILLATPAWAEEPEEELPAGMILHADTPLFGDETEDKWPQAFTSDDGASFGCASRVAFGDWKMQPSDPEEDPLWYRISNYGVFHCWANVAEAASNKELKHARRLLSFFILLDKSGGSELWALQLGALPGSDYLLFSRDGSDGMVDRFTVLQRDCPEENRREGHGLDILMTAYCHIGSREDLRQTAREMAKRKPVGTLVLAGRARR